MRRLRRLKWLSIVSAIMVMLLAVPVVDGGRRWTGSDPVIRYGGHTVNIWVEWPSEHNCDIQGPIYLQYNAPGARLVSDSSVGSGCNNGSNNVIRTQSVVNDSGEIGQFQIVDVAVDAAQPFPINLVIRVDGRVVATCSGYSDESFDCEVIQVF